jgi:hypothetical protein
VLHASLDCGGKTHVQQACSQRASKEAR